MYPIAEEVLMDKEELPTFNKLEDAPLPSRDGVAIFYLKKSDGTKEPYVKYANGQTRKLPFSG